MFLKNSVSAVQQMILLQGIYSKILYYHYGIKDTKGSVMVSLWLSHAHHHYRRKH